MNERHKTLAGMFSLTRPDGLGVMLGDKLSVRLVSHGYVEIAQGDDAVIELSPYRARELAELLNAAADAVDPPSAVKAA